MIKNFIVFVCMLVVFGVTNTFASDRHVTTVPGGFTACLTPETTHELLGAIYVKDAEYVYKMLKDQKCLQFKNGVKVSQDIDSITPGNVSKVFIEIEPTPVELYTHPIFIIFTKNKSSI